MMLRGLFVEELRNGRYMRKCREREAGQDQTAIFHALPTGHITGWYR